MENTNSSEYPNIHRLIKVNAGPRYYEDGTVNGEEDICYDEQEKRIKPRVPCVQEAEVEEGIFTKRMVKKFRWFLDIDGDTGIILNWPKGTEAVVHYKVCDDCMIDYFVDGEFVCNNDGYYYVPDFLCLDDDGYGDYMCLTIDKKGQIKNWNISRLEDWIKKQKSCTSL